MSKRTYVIFQPIFLHFFWYIIRLELETDIVASSDSVSILSIVLFDDIS